MESTLNVNGTHTERKRNAHGMHNEHTRNARGKHTEHKWSAHRYGTDKQTKQTSNGLGTKPEETRKSQRMKGKDDKTKAVCTWKHTKNMKSRHRNTHRIDTRSQ